MSHLDTFHAIRYRGIDGLRLDRLGKVNLITGPNGVGKTSLAEAVWLFNGRFTPVLPWNHVVQRSTHTGVDPLAALSAGVVELAGTERSVAHRWKARFETAPTTGARQRLAAQRRTRRRSAAAAGSGTRTTTGLARRRGT